MVDVSGLFFSSKQLRFMKVLVLIILAIVFVSGITSCYNNKFDQVYASPASTCDTTSITYSHDIAPIIIANCYGAGSSCHNVGGISGFDYTSYTGVIVNVPSGALLNDINWTPLRGNNDMPKDAGKLDQCDINKITRWIDEGYPDN